jgi:hypothetical protein
MHLGFSQRFLLWHRYCAIKWVRPLTGFGSVKGENIKVDNSIPPSIFGFNENVGRYSLFNFGFAEQSR